jgi:hypothetical protein
LPSRDSSFFLGVARQVLEGYLQHRYRSDYGIEGFPGASYLDKIVQMPFDIPPNTGRMRSLADALLGNQAADVRSELAGIVPIAGELCERNPRSLIRILNNILVDAAISEQLNSSSGAVIPLPVLAISRLLKERAPDTFDRLADSAELAQIVATWDRSELAELASGSDQGDAKIATSLLANPNLADLLLGEPGRAWLRARSQRQESVDFLASQRRGALGGTARYDVFLSCSGADRSLVVQIVSFLSARGIRAFFGGDLRVGESWQDALDRGRTTAPYVN